MKKITIFFKLRKQLLINNYYIHYYILVYYYNKLHLYQYLGYYFEYFFGYFFLQNELPVMVINYSRY